MLEFAVGNGLDLDRRLLADLCQRWDEPALKALVIEAALDIGSANRSRSSAEEWLNGLIERAAPLAVIPDDAAGDDRPATDDPLATDAIDTSSAEALLTALLIVRAGPTLAAARRLLARRWPGTDQLGNFVTMHLDDSDPLGRAAWAMLQG